MNSIGRTFLAAVLLLVFVGCEQADNAPSISLQPAADKPIPAEPKLSYNRDIRPILSDKCFACHGPDSAARAADLRLDQPEGGDDYDGAYFAIEPGDPDASELVRRITSNKSKVVMPPPSFKLELTEQEKDKLVRWIQEGAEYEAHWSFVPLPKQVELPHVQNEAWVRDPIDRFVLARLEAQGLTPAKEADALRWLRRVSYDLTGLPPTAEEIDAFAADTSDKAYEKAVDRLLASPHFGERMAVPWLDMARYADTYGYTVDGFRASWPWRDWVIDAFNDNLPYDQFLTWQVAGDLLAQPSREQQLATAFNRLHRMNAEGGAIAEEWRNEGVADRLHTFGTAFMGMTLECARCHDHRYDPIDHRDYYELFAFFNSIDESGTVEYRRADIIPPPTMLLPSESEATQHEQLRLAVQAGEREVDALIAQREDAFKDWLTQKQTDMAIPDLVGDFGFDDIQGNKVANRAQETTGDIGQYESTRNPELVEGVQGQALRFDGDNFASLPGLSDIDRWTPFTVSLWFKVDALDEGSPRVIAKRTSGTDVGPYGFDLMLDRGRVLARAYRHWPGNAIGVSTGDVVTPGQWVHVVWRYDGSSRAAGLSLVIDGKATQLEVLRDGPMLKQVGGGNPYGPGKHNLIIGQRFRDRGLSGGVVDEVRIIRRAVSQLEAQHLLDATAITQAMSSGDSASLRDYYFSAIDPEVRQARSKLEQARKQFVEHENKIAEIAVMQEMPKPRPAHVLSRGLYNAERTEDNRVVRDVPTHVMPWIEGTPRDRLGLSQWLTHPQHPLTARVAVNRLWQQCFGTGLVASIDNFGLQGALPTHPQLLDHLARTYIDSDWDTKAMLKRIVLSATYRQDSATTTEQWQSDPDNALLSRGPARRLDAEMIRDTALSASGLLVRKQGGPPTYPYQPAGLWKEVSTSNTYRQGKGESLYRRSLYTVWKRAVPMPNMMAFDTPTREACTAQRSPTNTPLQALVLLNDVQYVEAARVLAQRIMLEVEGDPQRVALGMRLFAGRGPTDTEAKRLLELLNAQRGFFADQREDALALISMGDSPRDESLDAAEHAALSVVMHAIFNLDATIWRR